jgi:nicotinamidase-related amidase
MRHDHILARENTALLVVDYQEKLLGAFKEPEGFLEKCSILIRFANIMKLPIIWTEQYPKGLGRTVESIKGELSALVPVEKLSFSCFGEPRFVDLLTGHSARQLMICGIETHICVEQTVLDGIACGYQMHIVADACGSRNKRDHKTGLRKMERAGAIVTCAEMAMYELLARSDAKEFRETLKLVK